LRISNKTSRSGDSGEIEVEIERSLLYSYITGRILYLRYTRFKFLTEDLLRDQQKHNYYQSQILLFSGRGGPDQRDFDCTVEFYKEVDSSVSSFLKFSLVKFSKFFF
jgi:hypothetical protein